MEVDQEELRAAARRWQALGDDLAEAVRRTRATPVRDDDSALDSTLLLDAVAAALTRLRHDVERLVDGLLLTGRAVAGADDEVAASLGSPVP